MEAGRPSWTAYMMAALRAHHYVSAPAPRIFDDSLAMSFCGLNDAESTSQFSDKMVDALLEFGDRSAAEAVVNDLMLSGCIRARFFEDNLLDTKPNSIEQVVVLGAGLDSTAYRTKISPRIPIYEVDHPATQAWKRSMLEADCVQIPSNLAFVAFDFESQSLGEALSKGGTDNAKITYFSWLGVQPYLTDDTVMATLDTVSGFAPGSKLVLDLTIETDLLASDAMGQAGREKLAAIGEPFRSAYSEEEFHEHLLDRGFSPIEMIDYQTWLDRNRAKLGANYRMGRRTSILVAACVGSSHGGLPRI